MGHAVEGVAFDLSRLDDGQLVELFQSNGNDHEFLEALNEELKRRSTELATELHIAVAKARRASAKTAPTSNAPAFRPVRSWLSKFLGARNLTRPTGKPLYRYRMTDGEYERAKQILRHLARAKRLAVEPQQVVPG